MLSISSHSPVWTRVLAVPRGKVCQVPTADGSDESTHPSVVDTVAVVGEPWNGYRYWMAFTPYPGNDDRRFRLENPSIVVSNDGRDWVVPRGVRNPVIGPPGLPDLTRGLSYTLPLRRFAGYLRGTCLRRGYNADPALHLSPSGTMSLAYVHSLKGSSHDELLVVASADGWRTIDERRVLVRAYQEPDTYEVNVPSIVQNTPSRLDLYYGYVPGDRKGRPHFNRVGVRRRSGSSLNSLGPATALRIRLPGRRRLWHHEFRQIEGHTVCMGTFAPDSGSKYTMTWPPLLSLHFGIVTQDTLEFDEQPLLEASADGWDSQCIYKPSFLVSPEAGGHRVQLWYSAQDARTQRWRIGLSEWTT